MTRGTGDTASSATLPVSAVVITRNAARLLPEVLAALGTGTLPVPTERS